MMLLLKLSEPVILKDHFLCTSLKWYQPPINPDFSLSEEFSPEPSKLDKKSEF